MSVRHEFTSTPTHRRKMTLTSLLI